MEEMTAEPRQARGCWTVAAAVPLHASGWIAAGFAAFPTYSATIKDEAMRELHRQGLLT